MIGDILASKMKKSIEKNLNKNTISKTTIDKTILEIKLNLLEADVNNEVVEYLENKIKIQAQNELLIKGVKPEKVMIKILHKEIMNILGKKTQRLVLSGRPSIIMMVGLQGAGKTTTCAKIAKILSVKQSKNPLLVACDIYRPAAIEQLKILGQKLNIKTFSLENEKPTKIASKAIEYAKQNGHDLVIIDTAGRLHIDQKLMKELQIIHRDTKPTDTILVLDGMTGQDIINIANDFNNSLKLTGLIITKLDGDTRGGATLSIRHLTGLPIKYIGTGEKVSDLQLFHPDRMADRILGFGDLKTLLENTQDNIDERTFKITLTRMMNGKFDMQDLLNQLRQMKKMGSISKLAKMFPGGNKISNEKIEEIKDKLYNAEIIISSMTVEERRNVRILKHLSRKNRIIKGSGRSEKKYNELINYFDKMKKQAENMSKQIKKGNIPNFG